MRISAVVATTEPIKRGDAYTRLSVEALESMVGTGGIPVNLEHNPLLLPIGKTESNWVEKTSANEASLHQDIYIATEDPDTFIHEFSKTPCVHIPFADSPGKFVIQASDVGRSVSVDTSALTDGSIELLEQAVRFG